MLCVFEPPRLRPRTRLCPRTCHHLHFHFLTSLFHSPPRYKWGVYSRFAEMCRLTAENGLFSGFVVFTIIIAGISVGIDQEVRDAPAMDAPASMNVWLWYLDGEYYWASSVGSRLS